MSPRKSFSSYVFLIVIYIILLVPKDGFVGCTVLEGFGQTLQENLANIEIIDLSSGQHGVDSIGAAREGRQFQDEAFVAPNINPFTIQPQAFQAPSSNLQTPQPSFRDLSGGGGGGFGGFGHQSQSVSLLGICW